MLCSTDVVNMKVLCLQVSSEHRGIDNTWDCFHFEEYLMSYHDAVQLKHLPDSTSFTSQTARPNDEASDEWKEVRRITGGSSGQQTSLQL